MSKLAVFFEEAERLYVNDGFSLDAIVELLKNNVSRKTLFNWKTESNWDKKRIDRRERNTSFQDNALQMLNKAIEKAQNEPSGKNYKDVKTNIEICLKLGIDLKMKDDGKEKKRVAPEEIAKAIRGILKIPVKE